MVRNEGLFSWWKGNGTNVIRIAPSSAIQFFAFDSFKRMLFTSEDEKSVPKTLLAGAMAGCTASFLCYPLDLVRSFLSVQTDGHAERKYRGIVHAMQMIVRTDGVRGLYRGVLPTLFGISPYIAINFTVFDTLRLRYMPSRDHPHYNLINLACGASAGFVAAGITYPTDTVRRRMQLQGMAGLDLPRYKNSWECIRFTVRDEGVGGLYKGMTACWLKVVPSMAVAFMTYEFLRKHWRFDPPKSKPPSAG
jgi:solute carrier family 25 phosphate transporter 23/24/25/41